MAITVNTHNKSTGVVNHASGALTAADVSVDFPTSGVANDPLVIKLGFKPTYVKVMNVTDGVFGEWYEGMAAGFYQLTVIAGDKTYVNTNAAFSVDPTTGDLSIELDTNVLITDADLTVWEARG